MKHAFESVMVVAILVAAIVIKDAVQVETRYVVVGGVAVVLAYCLHMFVLSTKAMSAQKMFPWLYMLDSSQGDKTRNNVSTVEEAASPNTNIYLVTPDLYNDARNTRTIEVVKGNLKRGITYHYITRNDTDETYGHIQDVLHNFCEYKERVHIFPMTELFKTIPTCNILVIDHDDSKMLRVFVELPVSLSGERRKWWAEAEPSIAQHWHRKILEVLKGNTPLENPYGTLSKALAN
jgi:hypothetical protein